MTPLLFKAAYFALICLANAVLAIVVFADNPRHNANRFFALAVSFVSLWTLSNALLHLFAMQPPGVFWGRLTFASASLIPAAFLLFAMHFQVGHATRPVWPLYLLVSLGLPMALACFTPHLVTEVTLHNRGLRLVYGHLYPFFAAYFLATFTASFAVLLHKYRHAGRGGRLQLRYLFIGAVVGAAGGATTNLLVPLLFRTSHLSWAGPAFSFIALAFIAHAIFRHRLMDIRIVLTKGAGYLLSLAATALLLSSLFLVPRPLTVAITPGVLVLFALLTGAFLGLAFLPMVHLFQALLDRYAYRPPYDPHTLLDEASSTLPSFLHAHELYDYLRRLLDRTVRPDSLYIYREQADTLQCVYSSAGPPLSAPPPPLDSHAIRPLLTSIREPLLREEIDQRQLSYPPQLTALRWDLLLPLSTATTPTGFVALGPKLSLDPYFTTDLAFLATVCRQVSIVLENASLYAQAATVKQQIERILDNMESGVIAIDGSGTVFSSNPAAARMLEKGPAGLQGLSYRDLPNPLPSALAAVLATQTPARQQEATFVTPSGRTLHLLLSSSTIRVASGPSSDLVGAGAVVVFTDHSQLQQLAAERRRADRLLDFQKMAAAIAHEIKNPLVAIKTFAELLPERFTDREFRDIFSAVAIREIDRIDRLVARLRGASQDTDHPLSTVSLPALIEDVIALVRPQLDRSRLTLTTDYQVGAPPILGYAPQLHQLFLNLLLNSIEAMPGDGAVSVSVTTASDSHRVIASVADTGAGIPTSMLDSIFDPFISTKPNGSGLGLAICRTIAIAHGALIQARNNLPAPGATIIIDFPTWPNHPTTPQISDIHNAAVGSQVSR